MDGVHVTSLVSHLQQAAVKCATNGCSHFNVGIFITREAYYDLGTSLGTTPSWTSLISTRLISQVVATKRQSTASLHKDTPSLQLPAENHRYSPPVSSATNNAPG